MADRKIIAISNDVAGYPLVEVHERDKYSTARVFCESANVRFWTTPGPPPTATVGLILYAAQTLPLGTKGEIQNFRAIREAGTDAQLTVELFE